jgi:hypothetical protein
VSDFYDPYDQPLTPPDEIEVAARDRLRGFFNNNRDRVFCSRQIEVQNESEYFHWITSRALRDLEGEGLIRSELRKLSTGAPIRLVWHKGYRFYKLAARQLVSLVNEYAAPNIGASLGLHGEMMVLEGFARKQFVMISRSANEYKNKKMERIESQFGFHFRARWKSLWDRSQEHLGLYGSRRISNKD